MISALRCQITEIGIEGFLLSRNLQGARSEEGERSSNLDSLGKMRACWCVQSAGGALRAAACRALLPGQWKHRREEVGRAGVTELGSCDQDVCGGTHGRGEAEKGQNSRRETKASLQERLSSTPGSCRGRENPTPDGGLDHRYRGCAVCKQLG